MNRRLLPVLVVALGVLALPASAPAARKVDVAVGIGDQSANMFADANYKRLMLKKARYFIEYNAIDQPDQLSRADAYVTAARAAGVKVLMHISVDDINTYPPKLPSLDAYTSKVGALIDRYKPYGVTDWGAWNEANHKSQPTTKNPKRAAQFYKAMKRRCGGCKVVGLDVLDQAGVERYIAQWLRYAGSSGASPSLVVGIHNYSEVNRRLAEKRSPSSLRRYPGTKRIIAAVRRKNRRAKFWYTETGGVKRFGTPFPCSASRQASRTTFMFDLARRYDRDIERLYSYNWYGADCARFDAGLVESDGAVRPAYRTFRTMLKRFRR